MVVPGLALVLALASCTHYAEVVRKPPHLWGPVGAGVLATVEHNLADALGHERAHPLAALGECLGALETASRELRRVPASALARRDYNFALGRVFEIIHDAKLDPWTHPLAVAGPHGDLCAHTPARSAPGMEPRRFEFTPADQLTSAATT